MQSVFQEAQSSWSGGGWVFLVWKQKTVDVDVDESVQWLFCSNTGSLSKQRRLCCRRLQRLLHVSLVTSGDLWWPLFFPLQPCKKWWRPSVSVTINILIFYRHYQAQEQSDQTILHSFFLHFYSFLLSILSFSDLRFWWTRWSKGTLLHCSGSTKIFSSFELYDDFLFSFLLFLNRTAGWMLGLNNSQFHSMTKQLTLFLMFWFCTKHVIKCSVNKLMLIWPWRFVFAVHVFQMYYCWFIPCVR